MDRLEGDIYADESLNANTRTVIDSWRELEDNHLNEHVSIDYGNIDEIADQHYDDPFETPAWRIPGIYPESDLAMSSLIVVSSAFNYSYNLFDEPGKEWRRENADNPDWPYESAMALHRSLLEAFGEQEDITADDLAPYFRDEMTVQELMPGVPHSDLRLLTGSEFIQGLRTRYDGSVQNVLETATLTDPVTGARQLQAFNAGKGIVELLTDESVFGSAFSDRQKLERYGLDFPFLKRAQLVALVYHGRSLSSETLPKLGDIESVGAVADYMIPRADRSLGTLGYSDELADMVDNWHPIERNSQMEVEIRGATVMACNSLLMAINLRRKASGSGPINMSHLDFWKWDMGSNKIQDGSYQHIIKTSAY